MCWESIKRLTLPRKFGPIRGRCQLTVAGVETDLSGPLRPTLPPNAKEVRQGGSGSRGEGPRHTVQNCAAIALTRPIPAPAPPPPPRRMSLRTSPAAGEQNKAQVRSTARRTVSRRRRSSRRLPPQPPPSAAAVPAPPRIWQQHRRPHPAPPFALLAAPVVAPCAGARLSARPAGLGCGVPQRSPDKGGGGRWAEPSGIAPGEEGEDHEEEVEDVQVQLDGRCARRARRARMSEPGPPVRQRQAVLWRTWTNAPRMSECDQRRHGARVESRREITGPNRSHARRSPGCS